MRVCVIGTGVIGTIYGHLMTQAGHPVVHYVRTIDPVTARDGIRIRLLDGRTAAAPEQEVRYRARLVDSLDPGDGYDLILASVRHTQLSGLVPVLAARGGKADVLFFNNLWTGLGPIDAGLAPERYLWGFPVAGGGFRDGFLDAALLGDAHLGELDGQSTDRLARILALFDGCGLAVNLHTDMLPWLWTHFAIEAGVIGTAIKAGDPSVFLDSTDWLEQAILGVREALAVAQARGVDVTAILDAQPFFGPLQAVAAGIREQYRVDRAARKIMERHTAHDELQHIFFDVLETGRELGVEMPVLTALAPYVAALGPLNAKVVRA